MSIETPVTDAPLELVVAVARKLAVVLHRLWVSGAPYELHRQPVQPVAAA